MNAKRLAREEAQNEGLRAGFDEVTQMMREAVDYTQKLMRGANLKAVTVRKAKAETHTLQSGEKVDMIKAQVMELCVLSKREQAMGHLLGEGIRVRTDEDVMPKKLTRGDIARLTGTLSTEEKRIADGMQKFLSQNAAKWGNEASMALLGYEKFGEENYWSISTDTNSRGKTRLEENYAANIRAIKS